jgi:uncharacterized DUF497 family protein
MARPLFEITCDPGKAKSNHAKHGVTYAEAATVLLDPLAVTVFDQTHSEVEDRWFTLGLSTNGRLLAVSHTHAFDVRIIRVRIISARLATRRERAQYEHKV